MATQQGSNPNSVLISLRGLRKIEDTRVAQEEQAIRDLERQQREANTKAAHKRQEEAERQTREEARKKQEAAEKKRREEREAQLRLQEAEGRARVEAEVILQRQRLELELTHRPPASRGGVVVGFVLAAIVVVGLGFWGLQLSHRLDSNGLEMERANQQSRRTLARCTEQNRLNVQQLDLLQRHRDRMKQPHGELTTRTNDITSAPVPGPRSSPPHTSPRSRPRPSKRPQAIPPECLGSDDPLCGILDKP